MTDSRSIYITANDPISDLDGWDGNDGREDQKREMCIHMADSLHCTAEINIAL